MKIMIAVALAVCCAASSFAQPPTIAGGTSTEGFTIAGIPAPLLPPEPPDNKNEPGYGLYKEGYAFVLDEQWEGALEKFAQMIAKFPKSEYVDDAKYWSAYSLKHFDMKAAIDAYRAFIKKYPKSTYYDDAVADLNDLQVEIDGVGRVDLVVDGWLVVECDSRAHHRTPEAQLRDRARDRAAAARGYVTLRLLAEDILFHPEAVLAALRGALSVRGLR